MVNYSSWFVFHMTFDRVRGMTSDLLNQCFESLTFAVVYIYSWYVVYNIFYKFKTCKNLGLIYQT